eukprot:gene17782-12737_t
MNGVIKATLAQATRFGHLLVLLATFALAVIIGQSSPNRINGYNYYTQIDLLQGCDPNDGDSCIYRQLIYRASFSLALLFFLLALLVIPSDYVNKSFWVPKFGFAIGLFIAFWWGENNFFSGWSEFARVVSFFWLIVQGLLLIDFSHDAHDILMTERTNGDGEDATPYRLYLVVSFCCYFLAVLGLVYLFMNYTGCGLGMFFVILTLVVGVITSIVSMLNQVNKGILTPGIVFAYSVFMCWYALLSHPDEDCNPTADSNNGQQNGAMAVVCVVSFVILIYCVSNGTKILNIFNPNGEGVMMSYQDNPTSGYRANLHNTLRGDNVTTTQPASGDAESNQVASTTDSGVAGSSSADGAANGPDSSGTAHERFFFHVLLFLATCYCTMILTSWGQTNGAPAAEGSGRQQRESMWLIIVSQWVFLLLYIRVLQVSYNNNAEA